MAEQVDLTPAEILARQRMFEEALARQNADAELFSRINQPRPEEQKPRTVSVAESERNPFAAAVAPFMPFERDVIREPQSTFETIQRYNPGGLDGEAFVQEDVETSYTPGEYGPRRFAAPPIVDAISGGLKFGDRLLFGDDREQAEARETVRQGIGALPGVPKAMVESIYGGAENVARGNITTRDAEGNITRPGQFAEGLAMFPAARMLTNVPENSFSVFGGPGSVTGSQKIKEHERIIYEDGMPEELASKSTGVFIGADGQPRVYLGSIEINNSALNKAAGLTGSIRNSRVDEPIALLPLKQALDPERSQVLLEYPELQDVNLVLVPTKEGIAPNAKAVMDGYQQAAARLYGMPDIKLAGRRDLITDNFYDPVSNTIYVRHDYERRADGVESFEGLADHQILRFEQQEVALNQKIGEGIQNYIQQREGFAPVETVPEVMKELSGNLVYRDRLEALVSELDPKVAQTILNDKNEAIETFKRSIFNPLENDYSEKVRDLNKKSNHEKVYASHNPFRAETLADKFSAMFVGSPRNREYMNKETSLENLYGTNFWIDNFSDETTNKLTEIFAGSPNHVLRLLNNNTFGANSSAKLRAAAKIIREAPEFRRPGSDSSTARLSPRQFKTLESFFPKKVDNKHLTEDAARRVIELETAADLYLEVPEQSFKDLFDTVVKADEQTFLYRQALSSLGRTNTGVNVLSTSGSVSTPKTFAPGAEEIRLASDLLSPKRKQELFGDAEPSAAALEMSLRDPGLISNQMQLLTPAAKQAYRKGEQYSEDLATQARERGIDRYDPNNPFFSRLDKSLETIKRDTGNAKEWVKDLRKKAMGQGVTEREFEILGIDEKIKEIGRVLETHTNGKIDKTDVSLLLQTIDRPIEVVDLSKTDPSLNRDYRTTLLGGGPATQNSKTIIWKQPPKEGDKTFFGEHHWNAGPTYSKVFDLTPIILAGKDPEFKHPNTFMHARTTLRKDRDEEHFLLEELQSEALQKSGKSGDVPLLKDLDAARMLAVETLLLKAAEMDSDTFSIVPGYAQQYIQRQDYDEITEKGTNYGPQYDEKLPAVLKKLAKRYGAKYEEKVPILVEDGRGKPLSKDALEAGTDIERKFLNAAEIMFDENTGEGVYVMARGIRLDADLKEKIIKTQIGRAYGGEVHSYAKGGMVSNMRRPVISRGLSSLIRNYSQGPLSRQDVPRETLPVGMRTGGRVDGGLSRAQQRAIAAGVLQRDDLNYTNPNNSEFAFFGDTDASAGLMRESDAFTGERSNPTQQRIEDSPASPPIQEKVEDVVVPANEPFVTTADPVVIQPDPVVIQPDPVVTTADPVVTTNFATPQPPPPPITTGERGTPPQEMARRAAEAEAERIRVAQLAEQQRIQAEQAAAAEAQRAAAVAEQDRLAAEQLAAEQLAEEQARQQQQEQIALQQMQQQQLAEQEAAQLAAQQNIDSQVSAAEQLANQQAADRAANEAAILATPDPTPVFQPPAPSTVDRGSYGVPPEEGTQVVDPNAPNFLVADMIDDYTSGYSSSQNLKIKPTVYPYQEGAGGADVYTASVFQPMPKLDFGSSTSEEGEGDDSQASGGGPEINWDIGSQGGRTNGSYVTLPTGQRIWVPDYATSAANTQNAESAVGEFGLTENQRYQCPANYNLAFEGGKPYCARIDKSQWPSGGRERAMVSNLPSRTEVQVVETNLPGTETHEYAQGGPVQNFNYGGFVNRSSLQQQRQQAPRGPFGQPAFQRFGQYQQPQQQLMPQHRPQQPQFMPQPHQLQPGHQGHMTVGRPMPPPPQLKLGNLTPTPGGPLDTQPGFLGGGDDRFMPMVSSADMGLNGRPSVDNTGKFMDNVTGEIVDRRAGPDTFTAGFQGGQMGPPQQIGQVAEPNTQQLASQLQNVTQQVNQLSSHLGVSGGGMTQGPSQQYMGSGGSQGYPQAVMQGGIGNLLGNLRPGPPPPQVKATGPARPPMFQHFR